MAVKKLFYDEKCIMTVDMDYVKEDIMYEYLNEIFGMFQERAYQEFDIKSRYEFEARKVWKGNEDLYELMNQVEQQIDQEIEIGGFEKVELLFSRMKERLNEEEFELFRKLRNEEVTSYNNLETDFFAGNGCLDYVWVERNGKKGYNFLC